MAKRIIQMYDKYKSTTKVYPKIIKESLEKDVTDYIEGQVVANPVLAGTEGSLTGIEVGGTKYKLEQPTTIVANPTLAGTEAYLGGIQIGDTKYKVPNVTYKHNIFITVDSQQSSGWWVGRCSLVIENDNNTPIDSWEDVIDYLDSKNIDKIPANGLMYTSRPIVLSWISKDIDGSSVLITFTGVNSSTNKNDASGQDYSLLEPQSTFVDVIL